MTQEVNLIALGIAHKAPGSVGDDLGPLREAIAAALLDERQRCIEALRKTAANYDSLAFAGLPPTYVQFAEAAIADIEENVVATMVAS